MSLAFPSTQWSLVRKLADPETREDAFQSLCESYWGPVFAFLCRRYQSADAEDITQEFFCVVLRQELFQRANPAEGKLRSWLLKSLDYCLANRARSLDSLKRGGRVKIGGLDDEGLRSELQGIAAAAPTPADAFDKAWLTAILHNTLKSLAKQYRDAGKELLFASLQPWLIGDENNASQPEAAAKCGVTLAHFRVQLFRLRKRYSQELRNQILDTLEDGEELEDEVRRLFQISKHFS
jgi:RNA polymerase sigma factor (sigma-70 family)